MRGAGAWMALGARLIGGWCGDSGSGGSERPAGEQEIGLLEMPLPPRSMIPDSEFRISYALW